MLYPVDLSNPSLLDLLLSIAYSTGKQLTATLLDITEATAVAIADMLDTTLTFAFTVL